MRFLSVCSGIESASVAWTPMGWQAAAFAEIEPFPCAMLAHHYPEVPNLGDITRFKEWPELAIDLLVGGTPCQSFSVAGLRGGLADPRGNLALTYLAIADRYRPEWLLWENVPGVLSSNGGRDFGAFLGGLGQLGYGFAYRVLDAQYVRTHGFERAVPQRRRRVFVVGYLGDWRRACAVLFERQGLSGHPAPRREAGERIAHTIAARIKGGGGLGTDFDCDGGLIAFDGQNLACAQHSEDGTGRGTPLVPVCFSSKDHGADAGEIAPTLRSMGHDGSHANGGGQLAVAFQSSQSGVRTGEAHATLDSNNGSRRHNGVMAGSAVRRLTPKECERLQGFPDGYTDVPYRGKTAADGNRYKALGNSMAVNCIRWIGHRVALVKSLSQSRRAA